MKQNITLSLEKDLLRKVRLLAVQKNTSVSRLLSDDLADLVTRSEQYEQARRKALAVLRQGFNLGGTPAAREELHDR